MTQDKRDWQKDMELCQKMSSPLKAVELIRSHPEMTLYWLQEAAAEKDRADAAEAREQKTRDLLSAMIGCLIIQKGLDDVIVKGFMDSYHILYPDTPKEIIDDEA